MAKKKKGIPDWAIMIGIIVVLLLGLNYCNTQEAQTDDNGSTPPADSGNGNTPQFPATPVEIRCADDSQAFYTTARETSLAKQSCIDTFINTYIVEDKLMHFDFEILRDSLSCSVTSAEEVQELGPGGNGIDVYYRVLCLCRFKENCRTVPVGS